MLALLFALFSFLTAIARADSDTIRLVTSFISSPAELDDINYISYNGDTGDTVGVYSSGDSVYDIQGVVTSDGYFQVTVGGYVSNNTYLYVDETNGAITVSNSSKSAPFEIYEDTLYYQGSASFYLLEMVAAEEYDLYWGTDSDSLSSSYTLLLNTTDSSGESVDNYTPEDAVSSYSLTTTTSTTSTTAATSSSAAGGTVLKNSLAFVLFSSILGLFI